MEPLSADWRNRLRHYDSDKNRLGDVLQYLCPFEEPVFRRSASPASSLPTVQSGIMVAWCGMRGIVTLAAALALPDTFPYRDLLLFTAFAVVLGTLILQGLTLRA